MVKADDRKKWFINTTQSHSNRIDYNKSARNRKEYTAENYFPWSRKGHKKYDLAEHDHPRDDIIKFKKLSGKYV